MDPAGRKSRSLLKRLTGILLPREWDAAGNILALSLMTAGEKEYAVHDRQLPLLSPFVRQEIEADCEIHDTASSPRITILSCRPRRAGFSK